MTLIRYEYPQLNTIGELGRWFNSAFAQSPRGSELYDLFNFVDSHFQPNDGLSEDDDSYYARFELPGVKKAEITVEVNKSVLTVKASRRGKEDRQKDSFSLNRSISLTQEIDAKKIKAKYEDGVLTVTLPKREDSKPRNIELN